MTREFVMLPEFDRQWQKMGLGDDVHRRMAVQLKISFRQTARRDVQRTSSTTRNPIAKSESRGRNPGNKK